MKIYMIAILFVLSLSFVDARSLSVKSIIIDQPLDVYIYGSLPNKMFDLKCGNTYLPYSLNGNQLFVQTNADVCPLNSEVSACYFGSGCEPIYKSCHVNFVVSGNYGWCYLE